MPGRLETALAETGYPFAHFAWSHAPAPPYGTWQEYGARDLIANGRHAEKAMAYAVDLYTRDDGTTPRRTVEAALAGLDAPWRLNSLQFEPDTGLIHYEWVVGLYGEEAEENAESNGGSG